MAKRPAAKRSISPGAAGALLASAAHELDNPLSVVVARAAMLNAQQARRQAPARRRLRLAQAFEPVDQSIRLQGAEAWPGGPAAIRDRIVALFSTAKPVGRETGVGLSACGDILVVRGGNITVGDARQERARFMVRLPVGTAPHAAAAKRAKSTALRPRHILVVDDEPEIVDTLVEILELQGHTVDAAESGAAALQRISGTAYDLIFSDLRMPGLDGKALFERLQQERPELARRMVIVTGDVLNADTVRFLDTSGLTCLEKPFTPEEVRLLASRRLCAGQAPAKTGQTRQN